MYGQILIELPTKKFHENPCSSLQVGHMDTAKIKSELLHVFIKKYK
jgi:hypothetical protein